MNGLHDGIKIHEGLYEAASGIMCVCLNELVRANKRVGGLSVAFAAASDLVRYLTARKYKYRGSNGEGHYYFTPEGKGGMP